jgi:hypothetical protein
MCKAKVDPVNILHGKYTIDIMYHFRRKPAQLNADTFLDLTGGKKGEEDKRGGGEKKGQKQKSSRVNELTSSLGGFWRTYSLYFVKYVYMVFVRKRQRNCA